MFTKNFTQYSRDGVTCMGFAPSKGRRCKNPISSRDHATFKATFYELANIDFMDTFTVLKYLNKLVVLGLCKGIHSRDNEVLTRLLQGGNKILINGKSLSKLFPNTFKILRIECRVYNSSPDPNTASISNCARDYQISLLEGIPPSSGINTTPL